MFLFDTRRAAVEECVSIGFSEDQSGQLVQYDGWLRRWFIHHQPVDDVEWLGDPEDYAARLKDEVNYQSPLFWDHVSDWV